MQFGIRKSHDETCRTCRTARRDTLVTTSTTSTTRVQGRRHSVDCGGHVHLTFPEVVPETDANPEHKRLNLYTQALQLLRRLPCWNKHGTTRSSRRNRHVVSRCDKPSRIWLLLTTCNAKTFTDVSGSHFIFALICVCVCLFVFDCMPVSVVAAVTAK